MLNKAVDVIFPIPVSLHLSEDQKAFSPGNELQGQLNISTEEVTQDLTCQV